MDQSKHLANSRLFRGLTDAGLSELLQIAHLEMFDEGELIFAQGDPGRQLYVVVEGEVRISLSVAGGEEALAILGPGNSFGEMSLLGEASPRSASAISHHDCTVLSFEKLAVQALLDRDHDLAYIVLRNLLGELAGHLRISNEKLIFLASTGRF